jgi:hypothetical protein
LIVRLLMDGLTAAAVSMRQAALHASLHPGATELELAQAFEVLAHDAEPFLGPMVDDLLRLACGIHLRPRRSTRLSAPRAPCRERGQSE